MKVTFNGITIDGSDSDVLSIVHRLGVSKDVEFSNKHWHFSDTKQQWIKIADMDTAYLVNAMLKEWNKAFTSLQTDYRSGKLDLQELRWQIVNFPSQRRFPHLYGLFTELLVRKDTK